MGLDRDLFPGEVSEEFICKLCSQVLLNPVTSGCDHVFCQTCVVRTMKSRVTRHECPTCSANMTLNMKDTSVEFKLKLLNLIVECSHKCGAKFVLAELPDHMEICPDAPVDCDFRTKGCKRTIKRCDKRKHQDECDYRPIECEACGYSTIYRELFTHQSRVRCLEKKLKQQIIRERKAASREINRHREKLFRDNVRLDQHQRKKLVNHAKAMSVRKNSRRLSKDDGDSEFEFSTEGQALLSKNNVRAHAEQVEKEESDQVADIEDRRTVDISRFTAKTPHSSRSGFAMHICAQCNRKFRPDLNQPAACRWHIGVSGRTCCKIKPEYILFPM